MKLVIDASMALAWIYEREKHKENTCAEQVLLSIGKKEAWAPSLWHTEIMNALLVGERRGIIKEAQVIDYLSRLSNLEIITDNIPVFHHRDLIMSLSREYKLTAYDATYLELALRTNAILATFDTQLAIAMKSAGGTVFE